MQIVTIQIIVDYVIFLIVYELTNSNLLDRIVIYMEYSNKTVERFISYSGK